MIVLHHVSIASTDLARSIAFYRDVLGLDLLQRPPFRSQGAWLACGGQQVHLNLRTEPPFGPEKTIDPTGPHFAIRTDDFDAALAHVLAAGFAEGLPVTHPQRLVLDRDGVAGFPQVFLLDPDRNTVEINASA